MELIFLSSKQKLVKEISTQGVTPYPLVKNFTSHTEMVNDCDEFYDALTTHAQQGHCLHKGVLKKKLKNSPRAGIADRNAPTDYIVFDLDGLHLPNCNVTNVIEEDDIKTIAKQFVHLLPSEFDDVSYIAQASASLGNKGNNISMHLFFMLDRPVYPRALKEWFRSLNYEIPIIAEQLSLSSNGQSLTYPIDISVSDNSKLIYIAPPKFTGVQDPVSGSRFVKINRGSSTVDIFPLLKNVNRERITNLGIQIKNNLRKEAGLPKRNAKTQNLSIGDEFVELLDNPDKVTIQVSRISEPYVNCNVNGGDSGGYYFLLTNPHYMYNFKGEPIWEIEKADPEFYRWIFEEFENDISKEKNLKPVVLRDFFTDTYYNGLFNTKLQQFDDKFPLTPTNKTSLEGFMKTHNRPTPEFIPDARVVFDPSDPTGINLTEVPYYVNMYRQSEYMLNLQKPDEDLEYGTAIKLVDSTPNIYKLISHILGGAPAEFEHFINWLAYIYQNKNKAMTAWILTGVPGTGKGLFIHKVLKPLFGEAQVPMRALENIEEHFNLYMRTALFLAVDEFRMGDSGNIGKMADKLKHQITEPNLTIRAMRTNQVELPSFCNFLFLTNRADAVKIEEGDRRYNVAPRQERKLEEVYPELLTNIQELHLELYKLAGILETFKVDERMAHTVLENTAKQEMRQVSMSVLEEFATAIKSGDLPFFTEILDIPLTNAFDAGGISTAQRYVKNWIATAGEELVIPMPHFKIVYDILTDSKNKMSVRDFTKAMSRLNIKASRKRTGGDRTTSAPRGVVITWQITESIKETLIKDYFDSNDRSLLEDSTANERQAG
tara:strand:- start:17592 stop:20075 length:2484 start_codon:yes stop_codon:yes gene_type:complete